MGKTRNQHPGKQLPGQKTAMVARGNDQQAPGTVTSFSRLRGDIAPPATVNQPAETEPEMTVELAWERFKELLPDRSDSRRFFQRAKEASGASSAQHHVSQQENNFLATDIDGSLYWYHDGLVFIAPVYVDNVADLENCAACGESEGAELDIYGLECQIAAALCRRQQDFESAAMYQALSERYYQRAAEDQYMHWPDPERDRPVVPKIV